VLCGSDDFLPGIVGHKLPNDPDEYDINIQEEKTISISEIKLNIGEKLELDIY